MVLRHFYSRCLPDLLSLKFRTFMAGSGRPDCCPNLVAYSMGLSSARPDPDTHDF